MQLKNILRNDLVFIGILWLFITSLNINKAFHMDDTFHLEVAEWITNNPFDPCGGFVNWSNNPEQIYTYNHPPLFYYLLSGVGLFAGNSEIIMHLFISLFVFVGLFYFLKLVHLLAIRNAKLAVFLVAFSPSFVLNQNLMIDVPLLCLSILFIYKMLTKKHLFGVVILTICVFFKYTALPLLLLYLLIVLAQKKYNSLTYILIPVLALVGWNVFTNEMYHQMHLSSKAIFPDLKQITYNSKSYLMTLGGVLPIGFLLIFRKNKFALPISALYIGFYIMLIIGVYFSFLPENSANFLLKMSFLANAFILLFLILKKIINLINSKLLYEHLNAVIILLWGLGFLLFIVFFTPFMASRHVLHILPPLVIILFYKSEEISIINKSIMASFMFFLTSFLAISDYKYADFYRASNVEIGAYFNAFPTKSTIYHTGHWGIQWYANQQKFEQFHTDSTVLKRGDFILIPNIYRQEIKQNVNLKLINKYTEKTSFFRLFDVEYGFYSSDYDKHPWRLSKNHQKTIDVFEIVSIKN